MVDGNSVLHLPELDAQLHGISYQKTITSDVSRHRANGTFVIVTLEITNRLHRPATFDDSQNQVALFAGGNTYTEDFNAENNPGVNSFTWQGTAIQPDNSQSGTVIFDLPSDVVGQIRQDGNVDILNFSDASTFEHGRPRLPVGVIRTYR